MSRPHEDIDRHTLVDHRVGGAPANFALGSWVAVGTARVKPERNDACVSAYKTLVEKAQTSNVDASPAVVFASNDGHRVMTMVGVRGHEGFGHLLAAWDDHHRHAQHRDKSESVSFGLYEVTGGKGDRDVDPASHDAYIYEHVERAVPLHKDLFAALVARPDSRGVTIFYDDKANATIVLSRFAHVASYDDFRASRAAVNALGSSGEPGDRFFAVTPLKTFALAPHVVR